jgi:hypothetical protein
MAHDKQAITDASNIEINVADWQSTHRAVKEWFKNPNGPYIMRSSFERKLSRIHVLRQANDGLILVQRDKRPATEFTDEGEKVVSLNIHADDVITVQDGVGTSRGFDCTNYIGDYATIEEGIVAAVNVFE